MRKMILVIDDESSVRKSFVLALENTVYTVETASSGEEGVKKSRKTKYDLIFCDLKMPGINGVETVRQIRKTQKKVLIYIATAFHKEFAEGLKKLEKDEISFQLLSKPLESDHIRSIVKSSFDGMSVY